MKINGQNDPLMRIKEVQSKPVKTVIVKNTASEPAGKAVELSRMAVDLSGLQEAVKSVPDVRAEKVEQLKQAIESGNYNIDDEKLADALSRFIS